MEQILIFIAAIIGLVFIFFRGLAETKSDYGFHGLSSNRTVGSGCMTFIVGVLALALAFIFVVNK